MAIHGHHLASLVINEIDTFISHGYNYGACEDHKADESLMSYRINELITTIRA